MRKHQDRLSRFMPGRILLAAAGASAWLLCPLTVGFWSSLPSPSSAQIVPDGTLPINSSVPAGCTTCTIDGGTVRNGNWFHSFSQFSVLPGGEAFFNNVDPAIQNIITRVTGGSVSRIEGTLRANGTANLFLINPSGIIFGPDAQLNLGGSFIASTANSLRFADGSEFSAVNPSAPPLLTVSVPIGLQYGPNPGRIEVQGPGNILFAVPFPFEIVRAFRPPGLQVQPGQTLALVGGDLLLPGGNLTAASGRVELGSVAGGTVTLTPAGSGWALGYQGVPSFGDVRLSQAASVDASGDSAGVIQVQGRNVSLTDGSSLLTLTTGAGSGGQLHINATDSVEVSGISVDPVFGPLFPSSLLAQVNLGGTGRGGDLSITTGRLLLADGAQVSVSPFGAGNGGDLRVQAQSVIVSGGGPFGASALSSDALNPDSGNAGNLTVTTGQLAILGGGQISANTNGSGNAGTLTIQAQTTTLDGTSPDGSSPSALTAQVGPNGTGQGGTIILNSNALQISAGAQVGTSTFGLGNAGRLQVFAQDIEVTGGAEQGPSGFFSAVNPGSLGQGGNLEITTGRLRVANGAQVTVGTLGDGNAGNLIVNAQTVELVGANSQGASGLFAGAIIGSGAGGDLRVTADRLTIRDGATLSVSNFSSRNPSTPPGQGPAGNVEVNARLIQLDTGSTLTAASAGGDQGNITLNSEVIELRRGSSISTNALGNATGGNIRINTNFLVAVADENSDITANAVDNFGGRVIINAKGIFGLEFRAQLTPFSDITASSALGPLFSGIVEINTPDVDPAQGLVPLPNGLVDPSRQIAAACERSRGNEFLITGRGGLPEDASQPLRGGSVWQDLRLAATPNRNSAGRPERLSTAPASPSPVAPLVEAQGWMMDAQGHIVLVAQSPPTTGLGGWFQPVECHPQSH